MKTKIKQGKRRKNSMYFGLNLQYLRKLNGNMSQEVQWRCQYEDALIQPVRCVMDICPGEYAAGNREDGE